MLQAILCVRYVNAAVLYEFQKHFSSVLVQDDIVAALHDIVQLKRGISIQIVSPLLSISATLLNEICDN